MSNITDTEIVTFRLIHGANQAVLVQTFKGVAPLRLASKSALSRCLSCGADGLWTDRITSASIEIAKAKAENIVADPLAGPMMALIGPANVSMRHADIKHLME